MGAMQPWHWIVVTVVLVILFGSKKLPDAARGLGRSMRIFKSEIGEMTGDGSDKEPEAKRELPAPDSSPAATSPTARPVTDSVRDVAEDRADK